MYGLTYFLPGLRDFRVSQYGWSKYSFGSILNAVSFECQFVWVQNLYTLADNFSYLLFQSEGWVISLQKMMRPNLIECMMAFVESYLARSGESEEDGTSFCVPWSQPPVRVSSINSSTYNRFLI